MYPEYPPFAAAWCISFDAKFRNSSMAAILKMYIFHYIL